MSELAILVPVLKRPHRVKPLLASIRKATPDARVLFIADPGDNPEIDAIGDEEFITVDGNYARKINEGVAHTTEPLLFFGADDLNFHPGWLEAARSRLLPPVGVVATNDMCNPRVTAGELATHPLVSREYCERGTIDDPTRPLHEGYPHEYVDREFSETAQLRGAFAYAPDSVVEHLHPMVGKAPLDDLYKGSLMRMRQGVRLYRRRRYKWTPPPPRPRIDGFRP